MSESSPEAAIGVIGGSGLYEIDGIESVDSQRMSTPFGDPSDAIITGTLGGRRICSFYHAMESGTL